MSPRLSRRSFLKLSAAGAVGWGLLPAWAGAVPTGGPRLASTLPIQFPHRFIADPDSLLTRLPAGLDLLLVPAYIAAGLIRRHRLQPLNGPAGRAHDPDGAYTLPYRYAVSVVVHPADAAPADPWQPETMTWPSFGRLVLGASLRRRGYSPNDAHAGHLAQAGKDLLALRPNLTPDPLAAVQAGAVPAAFAPVPVSTAGELELDEGLATTLPPWGTMLLEYDWVLPANAPAPDAARSFLSALPPPPPGSSLPPLGGARPVPLAPLPERAEAQHARLWNDLIRARRQAGA